jgi:ABC-type phosphate/phosphonate transport system ATPase subunit
MTLVHATTIQLGAHGVMLLGDSGSGKSDLALRLIAEGALLVSDDQTNVTIFNNRMIASAPETIARRRKPKRRSCASPSNSRVDPSSACQNRPSGRRPALPARLRFP